MSEGKEHSARKGGDKVTEQTLEEKYFTATFNDGYLEAVYWYKTLKGAKSSAIMLRKKFSESEIIVGERLE